MIYKPKRILITGGTGFIGKPFIRSLNKTDTIFSVSLPEYDLFNLDAQKELIKQYQPTDLVHLAWNVTDANYTNSEQNFEWVKISKHLIKTFIHQGGKRVVVAGSCREKAQANLSNYDKSKQVLFHLTKKLCVKHNVQWVWPRFSYLYGPGCQIRKLIPSVIQQLLFNEKVFIQKPNDSFDFLYIDDVVQALNTVFYTDFSGALDIGYGASITIKNLVFLIAQKLKKEHLVTFNESVQDNEALTSNITTLSNLNWQPQITLEKGLDLTIEWLCKELKYVPYQATVLSSPSLKE